MKFSHLVILLGAGFVFGSPKLDDFESVKRFPFVTYKKVWQGTPVRVDEVTVPNVVIAYGEGENPKVIASAGRIAYYLGQWTQDPGLSPKGVKMGSFPPVILPLPEALKTEKHIILVGTQNAIVKELNLKFEGPTVKVVDYRGRKVIVAGGKTPDQVVEASNFLADYIVGFKAGAYKTFFSFVKLRGMIEKGEFNSALDLIQSAEGLSACGKNMSLASPMMEKFPPKVKEVVKERNKIMYVELAKVLKEGNKEEAVMLWKEAMFTCYQCHQGIGIKRLRKFVPNEEIHSRHQRIAKSWGLSCNACHSGQTKQRGYSLR